MRPTQIDQQLSWLQIETNLGFFHVFLVDFEDNMFGPPNRLISTLIYTYSRDRNCSMSGAAGE